VSLFWGNEVNVRRSLFVFFASVCAALGAVRPPASAQGKRAFTLDDLYRIHGVGSPRISPDGRRIVYSVTTTEWKKGERKSRLWLAGADGSGARPLTQTDKTDSDAHWSPDGSRVAFVSNRDGTSQIWIIPSDAGEARKLTSFPPGVSDIVWSPDGRRLAFSADVDPRCDSSDEACQKKSAEAAEKNKVRAHMADHLLYRHWTDWKDGHRTHVFVADAESGAVRDLTPGDWDSPTFQLGGDPGYAFSPDGKELCFVSNHDPDPESSTNADLWVVAVSGGEPKNLTAGNPGFDGNPQYSPDGRWIAYRAQKTARYESDLFRLALCDRKSGTSRVLTETFDNWVDALRWSPDSRSILFSADVEGRTPIFRAEPDSGRVTPVLDDRTIDAFEVSPDGRFLLYSRRSTGEPGELYRFDLSGPPARRVTFENRAVEDEVDIRPAETMWVEGARGEKIQVFIVKPHGFDPGKKYPLILNVHGGPQSQWEDAFRGDWQVYPGAGYVVAFANPHGSTGRGQAFTAEISGDWAGAVFDDLMKVTDALEQLPYVDRNRMGAMGWSFGGYMMDWFEGHTTRFRAIASMMGLYDLRSFYGATEELWFPEWDLKGRPWDSDLYQKWTPSAFVKSFKTPCLVITGEKDFRVPYTQALEFFTDLQKMRVPSRLIVFEKAGHWPAWYDMALYYDAHLDWFHRYLGGPPAPYPVEKLVDGTAFDEALPTAK
jgi:dipeptidyl aminopeptidase/acylaminoacyl peptidase